MGNLLGENRFILRLKKFSSQARLIISLAIATFTLLGWGFFFYLPTKESIKQENVTYQDLLKQQEALKGSLIKLNVFKSEEFNLSGEIESLLKSSGSLQTVIDFVLNCLKKNNLYCLELDPIECKKNDFYQKNSYQLKARGNFNKIISFFDELERSKLGIDFGDFEIQRDKNGEILIGMKVGLINFFQS